MANADVLRLIALELDLPDLLNFCGSNKYLKNTVCNDTFWTMKLDREFPGLWRNLSVFNNVSTDFASLKDKPKKDLYLFLKRILTKELFEKILDKPEIASENTGYSFDPFLDLYDLLYNTGGDHEYGWINYNQNWRRIFATAGKQTGNWDEDKYKPEILKEFDVLFDALTDIFISYREGEIGRKRKFLQDIFYAVVKQQKDRQYGNLTYDEFIQKLIQFYNELENKMTFDEYIEKFNTIENKLQRYIVENTPQDIREEIREIQDDNEDAISKEGIYTNDELEFLQILHDAIRIGKLSIFDPVNYNYIMKKLTSK
jgi:hypothetical protein